VARRLVRIIYGMMKTRTEYRPFEKAVHILEAKQWKIILF